MAGVYLIRCRVSGLRYVGGTKHGFEERFAWHLNRLRCDAGPKRLQACFELYGPDNFEFVPLREFPADEVHEREREAIDALKPELNIYGVRARQEPVAATYDVDGEQLTVTQMSRRSGIGEETIRARIKRGLTGQALVAPPHAAPRKTYVRRR